MRILQFVSVCLVLYTSHCVKANNDYDGPLTVKIYHDLEGHLGEENWSSSAYIIVQNVNTGNINHNLVEWNDTSSERLLALANDDKFYKIKAVVLTSKGNEIDYRSFTKAAKLISENVISTVIITIDYTGSVLGVTLQTVLPTPFHHATISAKPVFSPSVIIRTTELGPVPDTATYIQKLEREREAKERGGNMDNRSFFAKYWMYILLVILFAVLSGTTHNEPAQNAR